MTRLWVVVLCLFSISIAGCDITRLDRLEKENAELKASLDKEHIAADYDLQAKCAKDSRAWFNENWRGDKDTIYLDFTNHYNKASNSCFAVVEYHFNSKVDSAWNNNMMLYNVYENSKYADFSEHHVILKSENMDRIYSCWVSDKKCSNIDEWRNLTQRYMNT